MKVLEPVRRRVAVSFFFFCFSWSYQNALTSKAAKVIIETKSTNPLNFVSIITLNRRWLIVFLLPEFYVHLTFY